MSVQLRTNTAGEVVGASVTGTAPAPIMPIYLLLTEPWLRCRLQERIPMFHQPPPPLLDPDDPELLRKVHTCWNAVGVRLKMPKLAKHRALPAERWRVQIRNAARLLWDAKLDPWTWTLHAVENWRGKTPYLAPCWSMTMVERMLEDALEDRPNQRGRLIPLPEAQELRDIRDRVQFAVLENAHVSLELCQAAADKVCTEQDFGTWVRVLEDTAQRRLADHLTRVAKGDWPWPKY